LSPDLSQFFPLLLLESLLLRRRLDLLLLDPLFCLRSLVNQRLLVSLQHERIVSRKVAFGGCFSICECTNSFARFSLAVIVAGSRVSSRSVDEVRATGVDGAVDEVRATGGDGAATTSFSGFSVLLVLGESSAFLMP
jgi:hypothetical protein